MIDDERCSQETPSPNNGDKSSKVIADVARWLMGCVHDWSMSPGKKRYFVEESKLRLVELRRLLQRKHDKGNLDSTVEEKSILNGQIFNY